MLKKATLIILFYLSGIFPDAFANTNDLINAELLRRDQILIDQKDTVSAFKDLGEAQRKKIKEDKEIQEIIGSARKNAPNGKIESPPTAIIFVSFSMPELALKQFIQDGAKYHVPVVMRGLYKNSFKETVDKMFNLVKDDNKGGIAIDPIWFKDFAIENVPAVVVEENGKYDVVYGNIPVKRSLTIISEQGEKAKIAKDILEKSNA